MGLGLRNFFRAGTAVASLGLVCVLTSTTPSLAQDASAEANNPLASATALNFQNQYVGDLTGLGRDANALFIRFALPSEIGSTTWITRFTLPIVSVPTPVDETTTALGDLNIFSAYLFDTGNPAVSFGIGPQLTAPTATEDETGSGKWSLGLANVLFNATSPRFQWGYLLTWQKSVGGNEDRPDVNAAAFQPFGYYQMGEGWYLRSSAPWTYDLETDQYAIPVGLGLGRVVKQAKSVVNFFAEPQYTVASEGDGQPEWGVFAGLNFQF